MRLPIVPAHRRSLIATLLVCALALLAASASTDPCSPAWHAFDAVGVGAPGDTVNAILSWDPDGPAGPLPPMLVVGGSFTSAGASAAQSIAAWDGSSWQPLGAGVDAPISALALFNNQLVAGGAFTSAGAAPANHVALYDGSQWHALGAGLNANVFALTVYEGDLIAAGSFTGSIARWDGSAWQPLAAGMDGPVFALAVFNNHLIAGGVFTHAGDAVVSNIAQWDGSSWQPLDGGADDAVRALAVAPDNTLIAGGTFIVAGGQPANHIARWTGADWQPLAAGLSATVQTLAIYDNQIYVGGPFVNAGDLAVNFVASFNGSAWHALNTGVDATVFALAVDGPSDSLIVGGAFDSAGAVTSQHVLRWRNAAPAPACGNVPDLGPLAASPITATASLPTSGVVWRSFTLTHPIDAAASPPTFLDIDTEGSALTPTNDTMLALYCADGTLVAFDDDDGSGPGVRDLSELSFGSTTARPAPDTALPFDGRDGAHLDAGVYFLAVTGFPAVFAATDWTVSSSASDFGSVTLNLRTGVTHTACNVADIVSVGQQPPPDGLLTGDDYVAFINAFFTGDLLADIVSVGQQPPPDGLLTGDDYVAFINNFFVGCQ